MHYIGKLSACLLIFTSRLIAFEKLPSDYLVSYGNPESPVRIIQYYSFSCPHCVSLFRNQFQRIQTDFIETEKVYWIFHPVPMDILTVQAMECLSKLSDREKKIFLEAILEEAFIDEPKLSATLMQRGMEILGKPIKDLHEKDYLTDTKTIQDAFTFLKQADEIEALPSVEVNGTFVHAQVPDIAFIEKQVGDDAR